MKKLICAAMLAISLAAQPDPVAWNIQGPPSGPVKPGGRFTVKVVAKIQDGWHLYSMKPMPEGPIPTRIWLAEGQPFTLTGAVGASPPQMLHDPSFGMEVELYEGEAHFTLPVRTSATATAGPYKIVINTSYQTCDNKICLPPKTVKVEMPVIVAK